MPIVKVLIVTDDQSGGFVRSTSWPFHIGEFVQVLADTDWDGFDLQMTKAHRYSSSQAPNAAADVYNFRFSDASLAGFDIAMFVSIATPAEDSAYAGTTTASRQEEAAAIARFMEAGKGFFASGDHENLGSGVNMYVPRVRSMRRWIWTEPNPHGFPAAPSGTGADRHDTLQPGSDTGSSGGTTYAYQFNDQSDAVPQSIQVKRYTIHSSRYFRSTLPHPLLCSPLGTITFLPDHMHEGQCDVPGDLTLQEELPGRAGKLEYPPLSGSPFAPEVIATGSIGHHETLNQEFGLISPLTTGPDQFGLIGAYDGHRVGIGRIVVDSTWHHLININLIGTTATFPGMDPLKSVGFYAGPGGTAVPPYEKIKYYFRNLIYWLIPANRLRWSFLWALADVRLHPAFEEVKNAVFAERIRLVDFIRIARLADHYFSNARGHCFAFQILPIILYPIWKPDFTIYERIEPLIDPWSGAAQAHKPVQEPEDGRALFTSAENPVRDLLLGSLVVAALRLDAETGGKLEQETGKAFDRHAGKLREKLSPLLAQQSEQFERALAAAAGDLTKQAKELRALLQG